MATQQEIADHLDLTARRIRVLVKDGIIPAGKGRGGYDFDFCRLAYIRYLRGVSSGQVIDNDIYGDIPDDDYSKLLEREKYREKKRQNDLEEKEVAPVSTIVDVVSKGVNALIPILETIPLAMKRNWPEITGDQITLVKKAIAEGRNALADVKIKFDE